MRVVSFSGPSCTTRPRSPVGAGWRRIVAAAIEAAMKADAMLDRGDLDGAAVWRRIVAAVNELQRAEPRLGEPWH